MRKKKQRHTIKKEMKRGRAGLTYSKYCRLKLVSSTTFLMVLVWKQICWFSEFWRSFCLFIFTFQKSTAFNLTVWAKFKGFRTQAIKNYIEQRKEYCVVRLNTLCTLLSFPYTTNLRAAILKERQNEWMSLKNPRSYTSVPNKARKQRVRCFCLEVML